MDTLTTSPEQSHAARDAALSEALLASRMVTQDAIDQAAAWCDRHGARMSEALVQLGLVSTGDLLRVCVERLGFERAPAQAYPDLPLLEERVSQRFLVESHVVPLRETDDTIDVAMADPTDDGVVDSLELALGKRVRRLVAPREEIDAALERSYGAGRSAMGEIVDTIETLSSDDLGADVQHLKDLASEAPVIRLVGLIFRRALESRASDIHIEPFENRLVVRYRIDGVMHEVESPPRRLSAAVVSRVKIMASLDIAERRLPQDGRIKLRMLGKELDLRVSTVPTMYGESVVLRILDKGSAPLDFAALGFSTAAQAQFNGWLDTPHGIVLVTGPTGSGKTTTLYAGLSRLNDPERKILTVEDPVEYQLEGVNQIQVKPQIGLSFANALRSIVRQDPDVIMIGEIRDLETAQIAVQSALTGHLVLSTLHTNDAASAVNRLLDMGVEDYLLTSTLLGVQAQRLVRTLCPNCREPYEPPAEWRDRVELDRVAPDSDGRVIYRHRGCAECAHTGYSGRRCIVELLPISDDIRSLVMKHATSSQIAAQARAEGMVTMYEDGLRKVLDGITTFEEVVRVTRET